MTGIRFRTTGKLNRTGEGMTLLLTQEGKQYILRLAFVLRGTEERILPESLLDDWGHEISGFELYKWVKENATHFPRAELFGRDIDGRPQQCFIRELDLTAGFTLYAYEGDDAPLSSGERIHAILLFGEETERQLTAPPERISFPLREAAVEWRLVKSVEPEGDTNSDL